MTGPNLTNDTPSPGRDAPGDDGFEEFVRTTTDLLHRAAMLLCGDHHLAEDLTQTTYAKVHARWSKVSAVDCPLAYARTVLLRTFLSHRRLRRSSERPVEALPEHASEGVDPSVRIDLLSALDLLPPRDRAVLLLRYWEDLPAALAAEVLGIGESACRSRAARALARLRAVLPEPEQSESESVA
jgi:RNA polymerase sigma-70 factor (sigma-E family)